MDGVFLFLIVLGFIFIRHIMKYSTTFRLFILGLISLVACKQKQDIKPELLAVKETVLQLDSMSVYLYGWEPNDSTHVPFDDSAMEELIEREQPSHPIYDTLDVASLHPTQEQYDKAKEAWIVFKDLCTTDRYEEALANFNDAHNDLILFLKHSTLRYKFYHSVVLPLMIEYEGVESAIDTYIAYLEFQQSQAEVSIALGEIQGNNYIPEVYPNILIDLAEGYMMKGDLERGMGLISNIIESINVLTGDIMLANYTGVSTGARLQQMVGNTATAIYIWEDYKQFLLVHPDLANSEEEVAYYMGIAEEYLKELRNI